MKKYFVTYSDEKFEVNQKELIRQATDLFDKTFEYNRDWLVNTDFYAQNKEILDFKKGAGYCLWKPYVLLETLKTMENGDILFYIDSADTFTNEIINFLNDFFSDEKHDIILTAGSYPQKDWTRLDTFIRMDCDEPKYHNQIQIEAGIITLKKTDRIIGILSEWLFYCKDKHIISDMDNIHGENFPTFKEHRYDQSVLTNLAVRHGLTINKSLRQFIKCNVYG